MTTSKTLPYAATGRAPSVSRLAAAAALRGASAVLARLAERLATPAAVAAPARTPGTVEFYADAGAPEGALYVDGEYVGRLHGVQRL